MTTKVINLLAGPGAGKSTIAAGLFYKMKSEGYKVELVTELAKERVYEGTLGTVHDQLYIFGNQNHRLRRLLNKVDYIITDSPLILNILYNKSYSKHYENFVLEIFNGYDNINFFLERTKPYYKYGRLQTQEEAIELDKSLLRLMERFQLPITKVEGNDNGLKTILTTLTTPNPTL